MKIALFWIGIVMLVCACGGAEKEGGKAGLKRPEGPLGRIDERARCDAKEGREVLVDLNHDGVPDVRKVYKTVNDDEVMVCREADLNFDGTKDMFVFYDDSGQIIRDECDLDFDKRIDIIATYAKGQVVKKELDTNSDGLVDRVRYLQNDMPIRSEGDRDGDGRVDIWEYFAGGKLVRVGTDDDGDGKADTWSRDGETESAFEEEEAREEDEQKEEQQHKETSKNKGPTAGGVDIDREKVDDKRDTANTANTGKPTTSEKKATGNAKTGGPDK